MVFVTKVVSSLKVKLTAAKLELITAYPKVAEYPLKRVAPSVLTEEPFLI